MYYQMQIPIGRMPINLVLISNGTVAFIKVAHFGVIFDQPSVEGMVGAIFQENSFSIGGVEDLQYNVAYEYKEMPDVLKWLQQQNLELPRLVEL